MLCLSLGPWHFGTFSVYVNIKNVHKNRKMDVFIDTNIACGSSWKSAVTDNSLIFGRSLASRAPTYKYLGA